MRSRRLVVAERVGERPGRPRGLCSRPRSKVLRLFECGLDPAQALAPDTAIRPEVPNPADDRQHVLGHAAGLEPRQGDAQVALLRGDAIEPLLLSRPEPLASASRANPTKKSAWRACTSCNSPDSSSRSAAYSRIVSSIQKRSFVRRTRLLSTRD